MKFLKILLAWIIIFLVSASYVEGQQNTKAFFTGIYKYKNKAIPDSLYIYVPTNYPGWEVGKIKIVPVDRNGRFSFELSSPNPIFSIALAGLDKDRKSTGTIGDYSAEPGDQVHVEVFEQQIGSGYGSKDSVIFTGKGSAKYNLVESLLKDHHNNVKKFNPAFDFNSFQELKVYLDTLYFDIQEAIRKKNDLIDKYSNINLNVKKLLGLQYAVYKNSWFFYPNIILKKIQESDSASVKYLRERVNQNSREIVGITSTDEITLLSSVYFTAFSKMIKDKLAFENQNRDVELVDYYNALKNYGSGKIKERFLIEFLMSNYTLAGTTSITPVVYDSLVVDASKYLISNYGKNIINEKLRLAKGREFFHTEFVDLNGSKFTTQSLKGKIFLIDMWGTGCSGCAAFHDVFEKKIWPKFKNNKDFRYLSINVDERKNRWVESLNGGKYSSKDYINVYTGEGVGLYGHPFGKFYNIQANPFILVVDRNGRIFKKIDMGLVDNEGEKLLMILNEALATNVEQSDLK